MSARPGRGPESHLWIVSAELGNDASGKRRRLVKKVPQKTWRLSDARSLERTLQDQASKMRASDGRRLSVAAYLEEWASDIVSRRTSGKTLAGFQSIVRLHLVPGFKSVRRLDRLTTAQIDRYYTGKLKAGLSAATVSNHHTVLHSALSDAVRKGRLAANPADSATVPRPDSRRGRALSEPETAELCRRVRGTRFWAPAVTAVTCGLRRGELLALRWSSVDFAAHTITVSAALDETPRAPIAVKAPKTSRGLRTLRMMAATKDALRHQAAAQSADRAAAGENWCERDLVFSDPHGDYWRPSSFSRDWRRLLREVDTDAVPEGEPRMADLHFHDLRHTHGSQLLRAGASIKAVAARMGHSETVLLGIYTHLLQGDDVAAVEFLESSLGTALGNEKGTNEGTKRDAQSDELPANTQD